VSAHNSFTAFLEGLVSRGGKEAGQLFLEAYRRGCRLDAWDDRFRENQPLWQELVVDQVPFREKSFSGTLPWDDVSLGVSKAFLQQEWEQSVQGKLTTPCASECVHPCGVCTETSKVSNVVSDNIHEFKKLSEGVLNIIHKQNIPILWRCIFSFCKTRGGEFIAHLSMQELFKKAFLRSSLPIQYTSGFNPVPRLEFAGNLAIGIQSEDEIGSCILEEDLSPQFFIAKMNESLPNTIQISNAYIFPVTNKRKRESLTSSLWGSEYCLKCIDETRAEDFKKNIYLENLSSVILPFKNDRPFRDLVAKTYGEPYYNIIKLYKIKTIARNFSGELCSYFELYKIIAEINRKLI
jgi:hypothetical protein